MIHEYTYIKYKYSRLATFLSKIKSSGIGAIAVPIVFSAIILLPLLFINSLVYAILLIISSIVGVIILFLVDEEEIAKKATEKYFKEHPEELENIEKIFLDKKGE
jgi:uncharacterized protein YneF (UPF0154 family)